LAELAIAWITRYLPQSPMVRSSARGTRRSVILPIDPVATPNVAWRENHAII
jgi:hypothetical protein